MELSSLIDGNGQRSAQIVGTADALLTDATDTILRAKEPVLATSQAAGGDVTGPADSFLPLANAAVIDTHQALESFADQNGLIGSVHGVTNLGETAGLGHIGDANLVTGVLGAPTGLLGGNTSAIGHIVPEALPIASALAAIGAGAAADAGVNPALTGPAGDVVPALQAISTQPLEHVANSAILDFHQTLEATGHDVGLADGFHGLTNFGETVGLGYLGGSNLATDLLDTPAGVLAGDLTAPSHIPTDVGAIVAAAQTFVGATESDVANIGNVLSNPVGHVQSIVPTLEAFPGPALANEAVDTVHGVLETTLDPVIPNSAHGIIGTGNALGLGEIGGQNALTDALAAPTSLISGDTTSLSHLPGDIAQVGVAVGGLLAGVGADLGSNSTVGALTDPATGGGVLGGDLPGHGVSGTVTGLVDGAVNGLGDAAGLGSLTQAVTAVGGATEGGPSSPVTGILQLPGDILDGASHGAAPLPGDGGATLGSVGAVVGAAAGSVSQLGAASTLLAPSAGVLPGGTDGVIGNIGHTDPTGLAAPVTGVVSAATNALVGGNASGTLGVVTGALGGNTSSGSGSHDLLSVTAGPQTPTSGVGVNVLDTSSGGQTHLVDTSVGTANAPTPTIANVAVLPDSIHLPPTAATGSDALSGALQAVTGSAASPSGSASAGVGIDLGVAHIDAPIAAAHADPFSALGIAAHHA